MSALHSILGEDKYIQRFVKEWICRFYRKREGLLDYEKDQLMRKMHRHMDTLDIFKT